MKKPNNVLLYRGNLHVLNRLGNLRDKYNSKLLLKVMLLLCLGLLPAFGTLAAKETENLKEVYHIYVDDVHVGAVDKKDVVQQVINDKVLLGLETYEDLKVSLAEEISIIPEKSFQLTYDNKKVVEYLEDHLTIAIQAEAIIIDETSVGYFANEEDASEVLKEYKLKYVDKEDLEKIEDEALESKKKQKELSVDDVVLSDVVFSKEVSIQSEIALPDEVLTIDQGVELLEKGTLEEKIHKVDKGEVMGNIAKEYDLSTKELLKLNPDLTEDSVLKIDQKMNVTAYESFVDVLITEHKKVEEEIDYDTEVIESKEMYKGEEEVKQKGKNGKKEVQYLIEKENKQVIDRKTVSEKVTKKPVDKVIVKGTKVIPSRGTGDIIWPANGGYVSSHQGKRWGSFHKGIDIAGPSSREISAADHGVVESVGYDGGYGNKVVINHNNGMKTIYAHLNSFQVKVGQVVEKGMPLGVMGSTGNSTGIHLHFEVYQDGNLKNPMDYF